MKIFNLKDRKIGIFGFGIEGRSLFKYLTKHSCKRIVVFDEKKIENLDNSIEKRIGSFEKIETSDVEVAFRSPGVPIKRLKNIISRGVKISSATNLFFANSRGRIIAVTGTKGKSTTVQLVSYMLSGDNRQVFTGGNIGEPVLEFLDKTTDDTYSIVELSSFQLQDLEYGPDIAVILPIFADHLDYHDNLDEYFAAKLMVVKNMAANGTIFYAKQEKIQEVIKQAKAKVFLFSEGDDPEVTSVAKKYKIPEINLLATVELGRFLKINVNPEEIAKNFSRLPFRIQFQAGDKGMSFYNDSAATNPISTIKAMATMDLPYILIAGGSSKKLSYENLAKAIKNDKNLEAVYLIGDTADEIDKELQKIGYKKALLNLKNLDAVFTKIKNKPAEIQAVLFSPASASFDQFENYKDRGNYFNKKVREFKIQ